MIYLPRFERNEMEYFEKESIKISNIPKIEMNNNYFGYPRGLPVARISFHSKNPNCREPLAVRRIMMSGNMAVRADSSLVEVDHEYDEDIMEKVVINATVLLMPCECEDLANVDNNILSENSYF